MKLEEYLGALGWSRAELARRAGIDNGSANRAANSEPITTRTAGKIAKAFGDALGRQVLVTDIEGLNVGSGSGTDWRTISNNSGK